MSAISIARHLEASRAIVVLMRTKNIDQDVSDENGFSSWKAGKQDL